MRSKFLVGLAGLVLACAGSPVLAATVNLNAESGFVTDNLGFETGSLSPWTQLQNGGGVYAPTSSQYTAGSDGLASGIVPGGTYAAFTPGTGGNGAGVLRDVLSTNFVNGNTYTLAVWVAMPKLVTTPNCTGAAPNQCQNSTSNSNFSIDLFGSTGGGGVSNAGLVVNTAQDSVTISSLGVWALYNISVSCTTSSCNNEAIVLQLRSDTTSIAQPHQVDFDIVPVSATPLPASVWLFGTAIGLGGAMRLRRRKAKLA